MRRAYQDLGWLVASSSVGAASYKPKRALDPADSVIGFSIGYDFVAEHGSRADWVTEDFGVPTPRFPEGVEDRRITRAPKALGFLTYMSGPRDRRKKRNIPAALLYLTKRSRFMEPPTDAIELAHMLDVEFWAHDGDSFYDPARDDIACAWSAHDGFAIHVRGQSNVEQLRELYEAMQNRSIAIGSGSSIEFLHTPVSFIYIDRMSDELKATVLENDLQYRELHEAADATGIEERLKAAGRGWYALSPAWCDGPGSSLRFFLNPRDQRKYDFGCFTLEELEAWIHDEGPVLGATMRKRFGAAVKDASWHLSHALQDKYPGWKKRRDVVYFDDKGDPKALALRVELYNDSGEVRTVDFTFDEAVALAQSASDAAQKKKQAERAD